MNGGSENRLRERFISGMSYVANTVNIITTDGPAGRGGVTVSAMTSVSADAPRPTLLVCIHQLSRAGQMILGNGVFAVNILKDDQQNIADIFAGRQGQTAKQELVGPDWTTMQSGSLRAVNALVGFDCTVTSSNLVGTHYVFFGEVDDVHLSESGSPLIYANRGYGGTRSL